MAVEIALLGVRVGRPRRTIRQGHDRIEVVSGHEFVNLCLHGRRDTSTKGSALPVTAVGRVSELEEEIVPGALVLWVVLVELDQLREGLRIRLTSHRVRTVDVGLEVNSRRPHLRPLRAFPISIGTIAASGRPRPRTQDAVRQLSCSRSSPVT